MIDYAGPIEPGTPAARRMEKFHMTLDSRNVQHVVGHIGDYPEILAAALDVLMPVVGTLEALDALPYGTKLLDAGGSVWWRSTAISWWHVNGGHTHTRSTDVLAEAPPVRVIWTPEADNA